MSKNKELAEIFEKIGKALEFKGENQFKVLAYKKASRVIKDLTVDIEEVWKKGKLREIPGIGEGIAKKIDEYLRTGRMKKYEEAMQGVPEELLELMDVQSLGPRTLKLAYDKLGVKTLKDLERVIEDGSLARLPGMGQKKVENIKEGLKIFKQRAERIPISIALPLVEKIIEYLKEDVNQIAPAGSLRRMKETVGDIDVLATAKDGEKIIEKFCKFPDVQKVLAKGTTKGSIIVKGGYQVDLRIVPEESFGAALQYFTGSKAHNIKLRTIAKSQNLKVSEYGVFRGEEKIAGLTEEEVYGVFDLPWIPPEIREDRGEIEYAQQHRKVPDLIDYNDLRGDLHIHSRYSDGTATIKEIAEFAKEMGYEYIAITDHSASAKYAHGITPERLEKQWEEIERVEKEVGIKILKGIELEIREKEIDIPVEYLKKMDLVIAGIHTSAKRDMTDVIFWLCEHPYIDVIAHPTGRLISQRAGYQVDIDAVIKKAKETNTALEINAYPDRLDLNDINARKAKEAGVMIMIGSDAHNLGMMRFIRYGIGTARRGWLSKGDVLNTLPYDEVIRWLRTHKKKE